MKVTEHEMRGLLTGKCVPADMRVNEELPAYLVRKFADLHSDIKKQETAYAQAVDSILKALKDKELVQDRLEDAEDKLQESREKLDAVLAENVGLKSNLMYWDDQDPEAPYDSPKAIADDRSLDFGIEFEVQVAARMPNLTYRVSAVSEYSCEIELVDGSLPETPATDALLNEVRAEAELEGMVRGAGRVALEASRVYRDAPTRSEERSLHKRIGNFAHMIARRIRAEGANP